MIGTLLALELALFATIGAIIGLLALVSLIPAWVVGLLFTTVFILFGPWAIAETWGETFK